jgi:hypothetical protein
MPSNRQGFITGLLLVFIPPVGLICLWILLRDRRAAIRARGEATERRPPRVEAMLVARYGPGVSRTRPRSDKRWTQMEDFLG